MGDELQCKYCLMFASNLRLMLALWNKYNLDLQQDRIKINQDDDTLLWSGCTEEGRITVKDAYSHILMKLTSSIFLWSCKKLWQWNFPLKLKVFGWICFRNMILTWDNLCKRGFSGSSRCALCKRKEENISHLFI